MYLKTELKTVLIADDTQWVRLHFDLDPDIIGGYVFLIFEYQGSDYFFIVNVAIDNIDITEKRCQDIGLRLKSIFDFALDKQIPFFGKPHRHFFKNRNTKEEFSKLQISG